MNPNFLRKPSNVLALAIFFVAFVVTLSGSSGPLSQGIAPGITGGLLLLVPLMGGFVKHGRNLQDAAWIFTKALPAAGASNAFTAVDTESVRPGCTEGTEWEYELPDLPNLVDNTKSVTVNIYTTAAAGDSVSGLTPIASLVVPGVATTGAASTFVRFKLPSTAKRYIQVTQAVTASGGDQTASSGTLRQLF